MIYEIEVWKLIGSWIGSMMLGGAIVYCYLTWKLDKFGWSWKMITSKMSEDEYRKKFCEEKPYN